MASFADEMEIGQAVCLEIEGEIYTIRREADGFCTCVPKTCAFLWLNATGVAIMKLVAERLTRAAIVARMSAITPLPESFWRQAVDEFVEWLCENQILSAPIP